MKTNYTAREFNLYTRHSKAEEAAEALNEAFGQAFNQVSDGLAGKTEAFMSIVSPVMNKYAKVGACDSEARDAIIDLFNAHMKQAKKSE